MITGGGLEAKLTDDPQIIFSLSKKYGMVQHLSLNEIPSGHTSFVEALTGTNLKKLSMRNLRNTDVSKMDLLCRYAVFSIFFLFFAFLTATSFFKKGF